MGACASEHTAYRELFVQNLAKNVENKTPSWTCFSTKMSTFLWWDYVCEEPAKRAWDEACALLETKMVTEAMKSGQA